MLLNTKRMMSYLGTGVMSFAMGIVVGGICEKMKDTSCVIEEI